MLLQVDFLWIVTKAFFISQYYHIFIKDFNSLLPFLCVFLHAKNEELRLLCSHSGENQQLCRDVQTLFLSLVDIYQCWSSSQYFKREFQTSVHQLSQRIKCRMLSIKGVESIPGETPSHSKHHKVAPGHSRLQAGERQPNFILLCLELLVPVVDKMVDPLDRPLLDACSSKLGLVGVRSINC